MNEGMNKRHQLMTLANTHGVMGMCSDGDMLCAV
jgi:hypothetical protein